MTTGVIATAPILQFTLNNGQLAAGGSILTQVGGVNTATYSDIGLTTPLPNPIPLNSRGEISDATGNSKQLFLTPNTVYTLTLSDASGNQIWQAAYVNGVQLSGTAAATALNTVTGTAILSSLLQTAAESAASVTPTNYTYPPGDLRRYGATPGSDVTTALAAAAAQSQQPNCAAIYIPAALGLSCTVTAGVTFSSRQVKIIGDGYSVSVLNTTADITIFSFTLASSQSEITGLQLAGKGTGATAPAVLFTNSNFNQIARCYIHSFGVGIRYVQGINSSYLNSIRDSQIVQNLLINIDAQALTNALQIYATTFGGGNTATGLKVVDSSNLLVSGFDCESCKTVGIDIDNPTVPNLGGHVIQGGDIEGGTSTFSAGAIRLGASNVNPVLAVLISGINSAGGGTDDSLLNAINCAAIDVRNVFINSGFAGSGLIDGWLRIGANAKNITTGNVTTITGSIQSLVMPFGIVCDAHSPYTGSAPALPGGGLISTAGLVVTRVAPAAAVVGIVLQPGSRPGQRCVVINESPVANTITFAAAGTSTVADGASDQIAGNTAREFVWNNVTGLWYRKG